jgi:hypothetical protein
MNEYEVWDINRYIEYCLQTDAISNIKGSKEQFNKLSKGFNFIIAIYNCKDNDYRFFSVTFFNDKVIDNG